MYSHLQIHRLIIFNTRHCASQVFGAFTTLRTATISVILSVRPSVHMEQLSSNWKDFHWIWYSVIFRKPVKKIRVSLKSDKNNGTKPQFLSCSAHLFLEWEMSQTKVAEKKKNTHFLFNNVFLIENRAFRRLCRKILQIGAGHRWYNKANAHAHCMLDT